MPGETKPVSGSIASKTCSIWEALITFPLASLMSSVRTEMSPEFATIAFDPPTWVARAAEIDPRYYAQLGQFYERQGKWEDSAEAYEEAIGSSRQPSRDLQIRYAAVLINMEGGAAKARQILGELLKASPNDTRLLYMMSTAERTAGDEKAAEATARKIVSIDATNISGLRALVAVLVDRFEYTQIVEVVTPLAKDPSRAKGREMEGAAVLVQLGVAQQQLANWDGSIAAFAASACGFAWSNNGCAIA